MVVPLGTTVCPEVEAGVLKLNVVYVLGNTCVEWAIVDVSVI